MIRRYAEQLLKIYNYIDDIMVTNEKGIIEYFVSFRPEIDNLKEVDILGKHVLDIFPNLTEETSTILRVLKDGKPIFNEYQVLENYLGQKLHIVGSTMQIMSGDRIIGAVDIARYIEPEMEKQNVVLSVKDIPFGNKEMFILTDIITCDPSMLEIKSKIEKLAKTKSSVLIYGETGTGKELVAQALHSHSERVDGPFISQNCAAIPSTLLESILFGTVKGSYTGAENRKGLFELANGGTLFLDEINSMELNVQSKILRAIEEKKITPLGGHTSINIDVRIVSAVNEDPIKAVADKRLRKDLFFRLGVVQINLPKLKDRPNDIKLLCKYFIDKYNAKMNKNVIGISEEVEKLFYKYSWPGNVRELKNVIEGAFNLTSNNLIEMKDLPEYIHAEGISILSIANHELGNSSLPEMLKSYEKELIKKALDCTINKNDAANLLKISRQALNYKLNKYKIQ